MADYRMPIDAEWFNQMSFQGRFDGATDHSTGFRTDGLLTINQPSRKRVTGGVTMSYLREKSGLDLRLNYEQYFYHKNYEKIAGEGNRVSLELIFWF